MPFRLWSDHRNACLLTLALLVISIVVSPWLLLGVVLPVGWVLLKNKPTKEDQPLIITEDLRMTSNVNNKSKRLPDDIFLREKITKAFEKLKGNGDWPTDNVDVLGILYNSLEEYLPESVHEKSKGTWQEIEKKLIDFFESGQYNSEIIEILSFRESIHQDLLWNCRDIPVHVLERLSTFWCYHLKNTLAQRDVRLKLPEDLRNKREEELFELLINEEIDKSLLPIFAKFPSAILEPLHDVATGVALHSKVEKDLLKELSCHESIEVRRTAKEVLGKRYPDHDSLDKLMKVDDDFSSVTIYFKNEPSGSILFGKLTPDEIKLLKNSIKNNQLSGELSEIRENSFGRWEEYEGIGINYINDLHFDDLCQINNDLWEKSRKYIEKRYGYCPKYNINHIGPNIIEDPGLYEEEGIVFEDGIYAIFLHLSKCSIEFEYPPHQKDAKEISLEEITSKIYEYFIPIRVPNKIQHHLYGKLNFGLVLDLSLSGEFYIPQHNDGEIVDRGYEDSFIFFSIKNGKTEILYQNHQGKESWGGQIS